MKIVNILGVNIHKISQSEAMEKVAGFLLSEKQHYLVTLNPEIILEAQHDEEYFYILNHSNLNIPDGIGLKFAAWTMGENLERLTGVALTKQILKLAEDKNYKIGIVNWCCGLSSIADIETSLNRDYPRLRFLVEDLERGEDLPENSRLKNFAPEIIFVTLGAPHQEKFIYHNLTKLPSVKLALGIGGTFDFISGKTKRAPKIMRVFGLEWLWRLLAHPQNRWLRAKRIFNAVVVFVAKFLQWRFILPRFYRKNVSCILYKKVGEFYKILLLERKDEAGHWQLPQGGTDGLSIEKAGMKELSEEVGTEKIKPRAIFANLHKYEFDNSKPRHRGAVYTRHAGYKGQKQSLLIAEYLGSDEEIKINFWDHRAWQWVDSEELVSTVHEVRKPAARIFLEKFNQLRITN